MNDQQILWLIIALVVLVIIVVIAVVVAGRRRARQREADRQEAERIRQQASRQQGTVAAEAQAADSAQREADAAEERAQRLRAEAEERRQEADSAAGALDAQLREADRKDPSVDTDREGRRRDGSDPLEELDQQEQPGSHVADRPADPDGGHAPTAEGEYRGRRDVDDVVRRDDGGHDGEPARRDDGRDDRGHDGDPGRRDDAASAAEPRLAVDESESHGRHAAPVPADHPRQAQSDVVQDVDTWSAGDGETVVDRPADESPGEGPAAEDREDRRPAEEPVVEDREDRGGSHAAGR